MLTGRLPPSLSNPGCPFRLWQAGFQPGRSLPEPTCGKSALVCSSETWPGQTSWSKALVRHGADPGVALSEVLGMSAAEIRVRNCGE
jgi:hypothetical protein